MLPMGCENDLSPVLYACHIIWDFDNLEGVIQILFINVEQPAFLLRDFYYNLSPVHLLSSIVFAET